MSNLQKFAIIGSRAFNNYYLMQKYLDKYLPSYATVVTGHANGSDQLAEVYAQNHHIPLEIYESQWEIFGKDAILRQRKDIVNNSNYCIAFWDGKSAGTKRLIDMFKDAGKPVTIIDISEDDIIKQDPMVGHVNHDPCDVYIGRGHNSPFGNPFKITAENTRTVVLAQYTDYLLKEPALIEQILTFDGKRLGCWCHNDHLCHGDVIYWLLKHAKQELNRIVVDWKEKSAGTQPDKPVYVKPDSDAILNDWNEEGETVDIATHEGTIFATGYSRIVQDQYGSYFMELSRDQLIRSMIHRMMDDINGETDDDDKVHLKYRVNDKSKVEVLYRQKEFSSDDFKSGCWYVRIRQNWDDQPYNIKRHQQ